MIESPAINLTKSSSFIQRRGCNTSRDPLEFAGKGKFQDHHRETWIDIFIVGLPFEYRLIYISVID